MCTKSIDVSLNLGIWLAVADDDDINGAALGRIWGRMNLNSDTFPLPILAIAYRFIIDKIYWHENAFGGLS
jgi:hypothetical protein